MFIGILHRENGGNRLKQKSDNFPYLSDLEYAMLPK